MWKFTLVLLLCLCKPFKDLYLFAISQTTTVAVFSKADAKVLRIFHSTKYSREFFAKNMHFCAIFDVYQAKPLFLDVFWP